MGLGLRGPFCFWGTVVASVYRWLIVSMFRPRAYLELANTLVPLRRCCFFAASSGFTVVDNAHVGFATVPDRHSSESAPMAGNGRILWACRWFLG